jgi:hypothetical protein
MPTIVEVGTRQPERKGRSLNRPCARPRLHHHFATSALAPHHDGPSRTLTDRLVLQAHQRARMDNHGDES